MYGGGPLLYRVCWFVTLLLAALGLVMGGAHLLELPIRMRYDPRLYVQVTSTTYRYFGAIGGPIQVLALLSSIVLAWLARRDSSFRWVLAGSIALAVSLALWFWRVQPVNTAWFTALQAGPAEAVTAYERLRPRWEYGHTAAFAAWLLGFSFLLAAAIRRMPAASTPEDERALRS